ncbi:MAG: hypothetical protein AAF961_12555 [Planctomycetota bacterium]
MIFVANIVRLVPFLQSVQFRRFSVTADHLFGWPDVLDKRRGHRPASLQRAYRHSH